LRLTGAVGPGFGRGGFVVFVGVGELELAHQRGLMGLLCANLRDERVDGELSGRSQHGQRLASHPGLQLRDPVGHLAGAASGDSLWASSSIQYRVRIAVHSARPSGCSGMLKSTS